MAWLNLNPARKKILKSVIEKLLLWLGFNVLVAVLPFGFRAVLMQLESKPIDAIQIFADGELLIVATAISAAAVGELI